MDTLSETRTNTPTHSHTHKEKKAIRPSTEREKKLDDDGVLRSKPRVPALGDKLRFSKGKHEEDRLDGHVLIPRNLSI